VLKRANISVNKGVLESKGLEPDYFDPPNVLIGLLALWVVIKYTQLSARMSFVASLRVELFLGVVLLLWALAYSAPKKIESNARIMPFVAFLYAMVLINIFNSVNPDVSWEVFVDRFLKFSMFTVFISKIVTSPWAFRVFIGAFLFACLKIIQEGIHGLVTGSMTWDNQGVPRLRGTVPIYAHPGSLAGLAAGLLPFLFYTFLYFKDKRLKLIALGCLLATLVVIINTGSRTAYLALFGLGFYLLIFHQSRFKLLVAGGACLIGLLLFVPDTYTDRFMSSFGSVEGYSQGDSSRDKRIEILIDSVQIFSEYPFGVGVYGFRQVRNDMFGRSQDTHNLYLEVLTNLGIQGGIAFALLIFVLIRRLRGVAGDVESQIDQIKEHGTKLVSEHLRDLRLLLCVSKATEYFVVIRLGLGMFGMDFYEIYWWFALGICLAIYKINFFAKKRTKEILMLISGNNTASQLK
jgi:putative inorganic carbon (HCO3(-)) transporter